MLTCSAPSLHAEAEWLRGGRLLSTHTSSDDGVVTSLAVDDSYIVIGMANREIHVFDAESGTFIRTLVGHDHGVWCLTLVSAGGGERVEDLLPGQEGSSYNGEGREMSSEEANAQERGPIRTGNATLVDLAATHTSYLPLSQFQHGEPSNSTTNLPSAFNNISAVPGMRGFLGPRAKRTTKSGEKKDQSNVSGAAKGWGQPHAMVVSGGCDRDVRVWDLETG
jgi:F-box and WD-40 domain protein CDC4